jgi:hypothetical protein
VEETMSARSHPVVVLSVHSLLGHGIAHYLLGQTGVEVAVVDASVPADVVAALQTDPRVVIFERNDVVDALDLATLAPHAVLIDVTPVVSAGTPLPSQPDAPQVETIVDAVHRHSRAV